MCGLIPAVLLPGGPDEDRKQAPEDQERVILIQVMKYKKREESMSSLGFPFFARVSKYCKSAIV